MVIDSVRLRLGMTRNLARPPAPGPPAVIYELHVGTFSPEGNLLRGAAATELEHLARLGVTGRRAHAAGGGSPATRRLGAYDGVLPYGPGRGLVTVNRRSS